ncbi:ATP-binding protein [uncultured Pseudokineococcus sp.]|uniref:ATP-binding protein n=1 Tax=uncultured Pseudokineococcus sp. TaxID=1642928 RepID=UPI0026073B55|nr:ATP-binding protein [uncultured Pseudokineococcus sp.]
MLRAIGLNHAFDSAVADLVDNSIDAGARHVLVRFVIRGGLADGLLVIDDGHGMDADGVDGAMRLGRPKVDSHDQLGHFGMGLKSASFSQASTLTVLTARAEVGAEAHGRRMHREARAKDFDVDVLDPAAVREQLLAHLAALSGQPAHGTVVQWEDCRTFPVASNPEVTTRFLEDKVAELRHRLGLIFHRLLTQSRLRIDVDVFDSDRQEAGLVFGVEAIDPFGHTRSATEDYPRTLHAAFRGRSVPLRCHIWPGNSDSANYRLHGRPIDSFQGLYLYRNDRLLMTGGWCGVTNERTALRLARVAVDIEDHLDGFTMSMEKSGVQIVAELVHAIEAATDGTKNFSDYLEDAGDALKAANRRPRKRHPILPPGSGVHPRVRRAIERETPVLEGEEPIQIRWKPIPGDDLVEIDRDNRTLWLNRRYRSAVLHGDRGGLNDAPLLKALLFLVYEDLFRGQVMGVKDKENRDFWNEVLTTAAQAEIREGGN